MPDVPPEIINGLRDYSDETNQAIFDALNTRGVRDE